VAGDATLRRRRRGRCWHGLGRHAAEEGRGTWGPERRPVGRRDTKGEARSGVGRKKSERVKMGMAAARAGSGGGEATEGARMGRILGEAPCSQFIFFGQSGVDPFITP